MNKTILFVIALVASGCAAPPRYSSIDDFPLGQLSILQTNSQKEVLAILGKPTGELAYGKGVIWEYAGKIQFVTVFFYPAGHDMANVVTSGKTREEAFRSYVQTTVAPGELSCITDPKPTSAGDSFALSGEPSARDDVALSPNSKASVDVASLQEAVTIATSALRNQQRYTSDKWSLTSAEQLSIKDRYIWRITFTPADMLSKDPSKGYRTAGGEVFVNVDLVTKKTEIRFGE